MTLGQQVSRLSSSAAELVLRKLRTMIGRGVVRRVNDSGPRQLLQVGLLYGEVEDGVERFQSYGMTSVPPEGSEAIALSLLGSREHTVLVAVESALHRPQNLAEGEVALHNDKGTLLLLRTDGAVVLSGATKLRVEGNLEVTGDIVVTGDVQAGGNVAAVADVIDHFGSGGATMKAHRDTYNTHTHGTSGPPNEPV